jgi:membrane-associated protease RseP (regulator of RpoE activity)
VTQVRPGWRETLEADPLGLAGRRPGDVPPEEPLPSRKAQDWALVRLVAVVALIVGFGFLAGVGETVVLVLVLIGCIVAHEFGHYIMAKAGGIKVTEFFVGFGPRLWSITRGETEYGVRSLPLGGYCRIIGMNNLEEVDPVDEPRTYRQAPVWRRLSVDVAGSAMHFLIALVVLFSMFFWTGDPGYYRSAAGPDKASYPIAEIDGLKVGNATVASPAQAAGFKIGDRIVAIDGRAMTSWDQITSYVQAHPNQRLDVTVERQGRPVHLFPVPINRNAVQVAGPGAATLPKAPSGAKPVGFLGIVESTPVVHQGIGASLSSAGGAWVSVSAGTLHAFARLVSFHGISSYVHMLSNQQSADSTSADSSRLVSPVGVVRLLHQAGEQGLATVLWLVAAINISIGIFNLLPLFPLDGGRVVVALYEGVRSLRRPYRVDVAKLMPIFYVGLGLILFVAASSLFLDLRDLAT